MENNVMEQYSKLVEEYRRCWFCGKMIVGTAAPKVVDGETRQFCADSCHSFYLWYQDTLAVLGQQGRK